MEHSVLRFRVEPRNIAPAIWREIKELFAEAASLMGTSMAGFVRAAAKEKARAIIDQESRLTLTRRGLGKRLLGCAVDRCLRVREEVAAYALIVDAKDDDAKSFYEHFGFIPFADRPLSLYLVIGS